MKRTKANVSKKKSMMKAETYQECTSDSNSQAYDKTIKPLLRYANKKLSIRATKKDNENLQFATGYL